jgi:hypothetical protein
MLFKITPSRERGGYFITWHYKELTMSEVYTTEVGGEKLAQPTRQSTKPLYGWVTFPNGARYAGFWDPLRVDGGTLMSWMTLLRQMRSGTFVPWKTKIGVCHTTTV